MNNVKRTLFMSFTTFNIQPLYILSNVIRLLLSYSVILQAKKFCDHGLLKPITANYTAISSTNHGETTGMTNASVTASVKVPMHLAHLSA